MLHIVQMREKVCKVSMTLISDITKLRVASTFTYTLKVFFSACCEVVAADTTRDIFERNMLVISRLNRRRFYV